ncbi:hypothetical protein [Rhizorhabdus sp. FW153]|uniref:hypothetical protein n=1 Tax=Rhizorhabdus sp. FW153 TaxID=3400216 RepID=UPI003CFBBF7E
MTTTPISAPELSRTEWKAVARAYEEAEAYRSVPHKRSFLRSALDRVTGQHSELPVLDPRADALRRFVCTVRRTRHADERLVPELLGLGFSRAQVDALTLISA